MPLPPLPIDECIPAITAAMRAGRNLLLKSPTGSGKTTRVAPGILASGAAGDSQIIVCEPRRLATRAAAARMAFENGSAIGAAVGYQVRFDRRASAATRILVVTEGILVRMLQNDPFLSGVGIVIFDEFHERNLDGDLALAMARKLQIDARPELRIIAMSATLETAALEKYLGNCNIVESSGSLHPVEIVYIPRTRDDDLGDAVAACVARAASETAGHLLVFLPGTGEIRRCREKLTFAAQKYNLQMFDLHGDLPPESQDAAIAPSPAGVRKLILSTNVAETSVTIDGVTAVIDSGLRRILTFDPAVALDRLELGRISKMSATQRAGRAGRTGPGICYRLWSEPEHRALAAGEEPECLRVDLTGAYLQLKTWGEPDPRAFGWLDAPPGHAFDHAAELLTRLGALDGAAVTPLGRQLSQIPAHPRIARLLLEGVRRGVDTAAATAAALLSERDPFRYEIRRVPGAEKKHSSHSDLADRVHGILLYEDRGLLHSEAGTLHAGGAAAILRARDQYLRITRSLESNRNIHRGDPDDALLLAIFTAYADRIARRRERESRRAVMAGGRGVRLADSCAVTEPELFVCIDLDAGGAESVVRIASEARREWIPAEWILQKEELLFDAAAERVVARRRLEVDGVALEETIATPNDAIAASAVLAAAAARNPRAAFSLDDPALESFLARLDCLREWMPDAALPKLQIDDHIAELCTGRLSCNELRKIPLLEFFRGKLNYQQLQLVDREAPESLQVPSGSFIKLEYCPGKPPVLAARIQELFGWKETPRLARGRVSVLLHLLAPNYRPQQITSDLTSFWNTTYQQVRKELRARYPRHAWPEDPWTAPAQRGPKRRGT